MATAEEIRAGKLTALQNSTYVIDSRLDPYRRAPKFAEDIRVLFEQRTLPELNRYLTFNKIYEATDPDFPELAGTIWTVSDIDGWWNMAEPSIPTIERGFGDGIFDIGGKFVSRDLTFSGSVLITSSDRATIEAQSQLVRKTILTAFNLVKRSTWLIVDEDQYKRASSVRLSGRPNISTINNRGRIEFQIGLRAADPIKYEWIDITDTGSIPAYEIITGNGYNVDALTQVSSISNFNTYDRYGSAPNTSSLYVQVGGATTTTSGTGTVATITTTTAHGLKVGDIVKVAGVTPTGYNGTFRATSVTNTTFSYASSTTGSQTVAGRVSALPGYHTYDKYGMVPNATNATPETQTNSSYWEYSESGSLTFGPASGSLTIINHGDTDVSCYIRIIGPLFGPAIIQNLTTGQTMNILSPTLSPYQVLNPSENNSLLEFIDIDTRTREVHKGDFIVGESEDSSRGLLEPLVDWIYLQPGNNTIFFADYGTTSAGSTPSFQIYWRSGWNG